MSEVAGRLLDAGGSAGAAAGETASSAVEPAGTLPAAAGAARDVPVGSGVVPDVPAGSGAAPDMPAGSGAAPDVPAGSGAAPDMPAGAEPVASELDTAVARVDALHRFLRATEAHVPQSALAPARAVVGRAGERLGLSRDHTVVALAGATGSGKSSIFNGLAGLRLSQVGVRRPVTSVPHACVWHSEGAGPLLDWLAVPANRRFERESQPDSGSLDSGKQSSLHGLVLLDLPDFDSVDESHRSEVDRLLPLVDLVVWVLDPQKYADSAIHEQYLRQWSKHRDITLVALNQTDTLSDADADQCLKDLRRLLDADGLAGVPLLATSAVREGGLDGLRSALEHAVAVHEVYLWRLVEDLAVAVSEVSSLVMPPVTDTTAVADAGGRAEPGAEPEPAEPDLVDREAVRQLVDTLATAAGVPAVITAVERAYLSGATAATGWTLARWARRLRRDPLRRLRLDEGLPDDRRPDDQHPDGQPSDGQHPDDQHPDDRRPDGQPAEDRHPEDRQPEGRQAESLETVAAQGAAVSLAAQVLADHCARGLPDPWPAVVAAAARGREDEVPAAMEAAIDRTDLAVAVRPAWWRVVGVAQWSGTVVALGAFVWVVAWLVSLGFGLGWPLGLRLGVVPLAVVVLAAALLVGLLLGIAVRPLVVMAARHARRLAERRLRSAIAEVASDLVVTPVRGVLRAYWQARSALNRVR